MSSLPAHASMATLGWKLPGQDSPTDSNIPKGVGLGGMVKITELLLTYRHAAKM